MVAAQALNDVGLKVGMSYVAGKALLIKSGWKLIEEKEFKVPVPFPEFPEVSCGSGRDAVCSVGFKKQNNYLALIVEQQNGKVIITGEY